MVNSVSYSPPMVPDLAPKAVTGASGGASGTTQTPTQKTEAAPVAAAPSPTVKAAPAAPVAQPLVSVPPLAPPLTSLALYKDPESGMQVSVVRNRITGEVVEQVPTERARRLAAMVHEQQVVAQDLQQEASGTPRINLKT